MNISRRWILSLAGASAIFSFIAKFARAESYPTRPIHFIVGFPASGPNDILARLIGQWLSERLGQPVIVEDRPGASSNIATEAVVRAPADGYTLLMVGPANAINASLYDGLKFNFLRDIAPVAAITREPLVMLIHPSVPAKSVPEFIAYTKANPGKIKMASTGIGSSPHVSGLLFTMMTGVDLGIAHYAGGLLIRAEEVDKEVSRINGSAPDGEHRRLLGVELTARDLERFTTANPSITQQLRLPAFDRGAELAWPPPKPSMAVQVAASMIQRPHPGANWASEREERAQAVREEHERVIAHYDAATRAREEREAAEDRTVQERHAAE